MPRGIPNKKSATKGVRRYSRAAHGVSVPNEFIETLDILQQAFELSNQAQQLMIKRLRLRFE